MGYDIHIERREGQAPIALAEWIAAVAATPNARIITADHVDLGRGITIATNPGDTEVFFVDEGQWRPIFHVREVRPGNARITTRASVLEHPEILAFLRQVTSTLNAIVRGDEHEEYDLITGEPIDVPTSTPDEPAPSRLAFRPGPKLEVVLPRESVDATSLANACADIAQQAGLPTRLLQNNGRPFSIDEIENEWFHLEAGWFEARLASLGSFNMSLLRVVGVEQAFLGRCAELVSESSTVITARWIDSGYDYWQNAQDPLLYSGSDRSMEGLPMRPNGLPPPLHQMVVDTSRNPGRTVLRDGYLESIGHRMWLGQEFFDRVPGVSRQDVLSASWLGLEERTDGVLDVRAASEPFRDENTADVQVRLRRLLFPTTADAA